VHEPHGHRDGAAQPIEQVGPHAQSLGRLPALLVADDAQLRDATLPLIGYAVVVAEPLPARGGERGVVVHDARVQRTPGPARGHEAEDIELVGDDHLRVGVEQGAQQAVAAARIPDEDAEDLDRSKLVPPSVTVERRAEPALAQTDHARAAVAVVAFVAVAVVVSGARATARRVASR
jgi:hypothetical protein